MFIKKVQDSIVMPERSEHSKLKEILVLKRSENFLLSHRVYLKEAPVIFLDLYAHHTPWIIFIFTLVLS